MADRFKPRNCWTRGSSPLAVFALALLSLSDSSGATLPDGPPLLSLSTVGFEARRWGVEDGLPDDRVHRVGQSLDGYLWVATPRGLAAFDGVRFTSFSREEHAGLPEGPVVDVLGDGHGRLWVRGSQGTVAFLQEGVFVSPSKATDIPDAWCGGFAEGADQTVWFFGEGRIYRYQQDRLERLESLNLGQTISSIGVGPDKKLWVTRRDELFLVSADGFRKQSLAAPETSAAAPLGPLCRLHDGSLGIPTRIGVFGAEPGGWSLRHRFHPELQEQLSWIKESFSDAAGNVWLMEETRLLVSLANGSFAEVDLPDNGQRAGCVDLFGDGDGNLWLATVAGLYQIWRTAFSKWTEKEGLLDNRVVGLSQDAAGRIWVVSAGGVQFFPPGSSKLEPLPHEIGAGVEFVAPQPGGAVWFSTRGGLVWKWTPEGIDRIGSIDTLRSLQLEFFQFVSSGQLLVSSASRDVFQYDGFGFVPFNVPYVPKTIGHVTCFAEDTQGRLYASFSKEFFRLEEGTWRRLIGEKQLGNLFLARFTLDSDGSVWFNLWPRGLARWSEQSGFQIVGPEVGIPEVVYAALDGAGGLWLNTAVRGVARVDVAALKESLAGQEGGVRVDWFDHQDGLGTLAGSGYFGGVTAAQDGRVWVATTKGVCSIDYEKWDQRRQHSKPPPVRFEEVIADGQPVPFSAKDRSVVVPATARSVDVRFTAIDLSRPDLTRFKCQLEGYDEGWLEIGRQRTARYRNLGAGDYVFRVTAASRFGVWNSEDTSLVIHVLPVWWQSAWFKGAGAVVVLALAGLVVLDKSRRVERARGRQLEFARQLISAHEQERKRMAGEMRARLGQRLLVAKNIALLGVKLNANNAQTANQFDEISDAVSGALNEARDLSETLHPPALETLGLSNALRALALRFDDSSNVKCHLELDDIDGIFSASDSLLVYRLVEQSFNSLAEQEPSKILFSARREKSRVRFVAVSEDPAKPTTGASPSLCLSGLKERARLLGGQFQCVSTPGQPTVLTVEIPLPAEQGN